MLRPRVSLAARRRWRAALSAALCAAALAGCRATRTPVPLDDDLTSPPAAQPDTTAPLAIANIAVPEPPAPPAAHRLSEEALPELEVLPPAPAAAADTAPAAINAAAPGAASAAPLAAAAFPLEAPSPLASVGVATPPNIAAATRLAEAARIRLAAGDDAAALEQLERAIAIDSGNPYAYFFLAMLHLRHRTYDQAIAFADRAASLSEPGAPAWASRAYALQGNAFESVGRFSDARNAYTRAVGAAPNNLSALAGLARTGAPPPSVAAPGPPLGPPPGPPPGPP